MVCPLYKDLRRKYIPFSSWPTVNRFIRYMALSNKVMLLKIAHVLENAFKIRSEKIANMNIYIFVCFPMIRCRYIYNCITVSFYNCYISVYYMFSQKHVNVDC